MKKVFSVLFIASLALPALWAQDEEGGALKITGAIKTGIKLEAGNEKSGAHSEDLTIQPYNDDAGKQFRADVQVDYATANAGASVRLRADDDNHPLAPNVFSPIGHAYGWFSFLNNIVEVSAGMLDNAKWGTFDGFNIDDNIDNYHGVKLEIRPIEAFSIGVNTVNLKNVLTGQAESKKFNGAFLGTVIGLKYKTEPFGVAAEFIIRDDNNNATGIFIENFKSHDKSGTVDDIKKYFVLNNVHHKQRGGADFGLLASAYFYGVTNLKLDLDAYFATTGKNDDKDDSERYKKEAGTFGIAVQGLYYISEPFYVGLKAVFGLGQTAQDGKGLGVWDLQLTPKAGYTVNSWLGLGLEIPVGIYDNIYKVGDIDPDPAKDWKGEFALGVKPKATFTISPNAQFVLFYLLETWTPGWYDVTGQSKPDGAVNHNIQLDFIYTF
ncbi:MAG: anti-lipopolysaccharide factor [Spirochaetaceae bacterium]|nr:anti-lipopolysaccharide factor [Spirochaetaceae bacterium]